MYDLIIIGGGPSGLTAALYAGRARLKTLILEKMILGGQMILTPDIENFPGFFGGVSTEKLTQEMRKQVEHLGVEIKIDEITDIVNDNQEFRLIGVEGGYQAKCVIVATGANPRKLNIPGEGSFIAKGVSYCGTCDGPLFKGKEIFCIGGGDKAVEEAIYLTKYAKKVTLIHRRDELRASKILQERLFQNEKIEILWSTVVMEIQGARSVESVKLKDLKTDVARQARCGGIFIFVGINPNTVFLKDLVKFDEEGFIITGENMMSSCAGIFACGDCRRRALNQVITACSDGAIAAFSADHYLSTK